MAGGSRLGTPPDDDAVTTSVPGLLDQPGMAAGLLLLSHSS
jgi:hypothetical protein